MTTEAPPAAPPSRQHRALKGQTSVQLFCEALDSLRRLGRRTTLALLGIVMGSASIIALLGIGQNATTEALRIFQGLGAQTLLISFPPQYLRSSRQSTANIDLAEIRHTVPDLAFIAPVQINSAQVRLHGKTADTTLVGTTEDLSRTLAFHPDDGRFLSAFDQNEAYAVIGAKVARDLQDEGQPAKVGDLLKIERHFFEIIGILQGQASSGFIPFVIDDAVFLSQGRFRRVRQQTEISALIGLGRSEERLPALAEALESYFSKTLAGRAVDIQLPETLLESIRQQSATFSRLLTGVGAVSLLGGGIGVMNVMLMSVATRRHEIGLRIALGATPRSIKALFLTEAAILSIIGALLGTLLGSGISLAFAYVSGWALTLSGTAVLTGSGTSLLTGIFFGLHPAITASRLHAAHALRHV